MVEQNLACFINIFTYRMRLWGLFSIYIYVELVFCTFSTPLSIPKPT